MDRDRSSTEERIERYQRHIRQAASDVGTVEFFYRSPASRPTARYGSAAHDRAKRDRAEQQLLATFVNEVIDSIAAEGTPHGTLTSGKVPQPGLRPAARFPLARPRNRAKARPFARLKCSVLCGYPGTHGLQTAAQEAAGKSTTAHPAAADAAGTHLPEQRGPRRARAC